MRTPEIFSRFASAVLVAGFCAAGCRDRCEHDAEEVKDHLSKATEAMGSENCVEVIHQIVKARASINCDDEKSRQLLQDMLDGVERDARAACKIPWNPPRGDKDSNKR